jgi:hypothetical protein
MVRIRPFNAIEIAHELEQARKSKLSGSHGGLTSPSQSSSMSMEPPPLESVLHVSPDHVVTVLDAAAGFRAKEAFKFDEVFWSVPPTQFEALEPVPIATQVDVYRAVGVPAAEAVLSGRNSCTFAYGQTGSGKTHTMMGYAGDPGIIPRTVQRLFQLVADSPPHLEHEVTASFMEIYNEKVRDLLDAAAVQAKDGSFADRKVRFNPEIGTYVEGLRRTPITTSAECDDVMVAGTTYRTTAATKMNDTSSRSHAILQLHVCKTDKHSGFRRRAVLNLVDLAGSERIRMSGVTGNGLREAKNINQSLSTLRRVIDTLMENSQKAGRTRAHVVPYRESVLTWVLSDSLGGNCQTCMLGMTSPHHLNIEDTINTLRYCLRAKAITCHVRVNEEKCKIVVGALKAEMDQLRRQQEDAAERARVEALERERKAAEEDETRRKAQQDRRMQTVASARAKAALAKHAAELKRLHEQLDAKNLIASESARFEEEALNMTVLMSTHSRMMEEEQLKMVEAKRAMQEAEDEIARHHEVREAIGVKEREAQERRHREWQREIAGIFRTATRFGRDRQDMAVVKEENDRLQGLVRKLELEFARLNRRQATMIEAIDVLHKHHEAAMERGTEVSEQISDAVEGKARRMRELSLTLSNYNVRIRDVKAALEDTNAAVEAAYSALDRNNVELRAMLRAEGQESSRAASEALARAMHLERLEIVRGLATGRKAIASGRHDNARADDARLRGHSAALDDEISRLRADVQQLQQDTQLATCERIAAADGLPDVLRKTEIERRVRTRLRNADIDLLDFLRENQKELPAHVLAYLDHATTAVSDRRSPGPRDGSSPPPTPRAGNTARESTADTLMAKLISIADGSSPASSGRRSGSPGLAGW